MCALNQPWLSTCLLFNEQRRKNTFLLLVSFRMCASCVLYLICVIYCIILINIYIFHIGTYIGLARDFTDNHSFFDDQWFIYAAAEKFPNTAQRTRHRIGCFNFNELNLFFFAFFRFCSSFTGVFIRLNGWFGYVNG